MAARFIRKQIYDARQFGPQILIKRGYLASKIIIGLLLAVVPLIVVRLLRPVVVLRFGKLISHRIGPYVAEPEVYLSELEAGMHGGRFIDIFHNERFISNSQVKIMWGRTLKVVQPTSYIALLNDLVPRGGIHKIPWRSYQQRDNYGTFAQSETHLKFSPQEEEIAEAALADMGVPYGAKFVCFHARDSSYGETFGTGNDVGRVDYRNSDISTYLPAMNELTSRGYYALRMGAVVDKPLVIDNPMIIDYATTSRTELLDLYLSWRCEFFVGSAVGITYLPMAFRTPIVNTNFVPIGVLLAWHPQDLCITKKLYVPEEDRYMKLREIIDSGVSMYSRSWQYKNKGIELIDSTPEEISEVVVEMDDRINGRWESTVEEEQLQLEFWKYFDSNQVQLAPQALIGREILQQNRWMLG